MIQDTLNERGKVYGSFDNNAEIAQQLKLIVRRNNGGLAPAQRESLEVIMQKVSRILTGDPCYKDNWHDIAGYATLIENELKND
jgi:hypothetical protein